MDEYALWHQIMEELLSAQTHKETVRRLTEQVGRWMEVEADGESAHVQKRA